MKKILSLAIAIIIFVAAGCSFSTKPKVTKVYPEKEKAQQKAADNSLQRNESYHVSNAAEDTNNKTNKKTNGETKPVKIGEVTAQPVYDNKIIGWGLKQNTDQKPPEVPSSWVEMLKKYNGYYIGDTAKKEVYLTFDEGYEAGNTGRILDILKENGVKAAFFVTGHFVKTNPELVIRMVKEGHIVGNHTVNHPSMPTISNEKIKQELDGVQEAVYSLTHYKMKYMRPPKGEFNERTLAYTNELGYKTVFWSLALADWQPLPGGPEESYNTVMKYLHPGAVILLHAVSKDDTEALDRIIKSIKQQGYVFKSLDQLQ